MARTTNRNLLEDKIKKAEQDVFRAKEKYEAATSNLKKLLDKRNALRTEEMITATSNSKRSYEEILKYINFTDIGTE